MFPPGSISKQFTAATILALADAGQLRLDARVGDYLPEWFADEPDLRIVHPHAQTSGLADFHWLEGYRPLAEKPATPIAAYVALAAAVPRRFAPGARWAYSNTNDKALALIIERVTKRPFDDVPTATVLRPAGIEGIVACHSLAADKVVPGISAEGRSAPLDASAAAYAGDGGLCGSAAALEKWLEIGFAGRKGIASRLARPTRLDDGTEVPYEFGVSTRKFPGHPAEWHAGNVDSHSALIAYLPEDDMQVEIDLIGRMKFVPAGPAEHVAEKYPATFRNRLPTDGSRDAFETDWGEVRSYARRFATEGAMRLLPLLRPVPLPPGHTVELPTLLGTLRIRTSQRV